jgi:hypothetical protein
MSKRVIVSGLITFFVLVFFLIVFWFNNKNKAKQSEGNSARESVGMVEKVKEEISEKTEKVEDFFQQKDNADKLESGTAVDEVNSYILHKNISVTLFWVGEKANDDNDDISNSPSAWDEKWKKHFGGTDSPKRRNGFYPADFVPKENPFYVALPYNDFNDKGDRKKSAASIIPWAKEQEYKKTESMCKNHWVKISKDSKVVYAQWEDVGPFEENDEEYVFGSDSPKSKTNKNAGIDVSPAVNDYLDLKDLDKVDWQFVDDKEVPEGPWKKIVTTSQISWD